MEPALKRKVIAVVLTLVGINVGAIVLNAVVAFALDNPDAGDGSLFSYGILAWLLGLRHACDADHIAAIDNTTRRLALLRRESLFVGGWFALGHSTIVTIMCLVVAVSSSAASDALDKAGTVAGIIGTSISLTFLTVIGFANVWVLAALVRRQRALNRNAAKHISPDNDDDGFQLRELDTDDALSPGEMLVHKPAGDIDDNDKAGSAGLGCFMRCCPTLLRSVDRAYKMYWVGFVFGLGFDTATEISLLAITAVTSAKSSWVFAPLFALLFTSGMTMIDTFDGLLVRWAIDRITADRQLFFNIGITGLATVLALIAAIMQAMSLVVTAYPDDGSEDTPFIAFWRNLASEYVGMFFIGIFLLGVVVLVLSDRLRERAKALRAARVVHT